MRFNSSWFKHANPSWNSTKNTTALARVVKYFARQERQNGSIQGYMALGDSSNKAAIEGLLAKVFGGYLTDALARSSFGGRTIVRLPDTDWKFVDLVQQYGDRGGIHKYTPHSHNHNITLDQWGELTNEINGSFHEVVERFESFLAIDIQAERYGYGTGQQRKTASFAQAMLFIYLGAIAIYSATITIYSATIVVSKEPEYLEGGKPGGRRRSVIPWADMQDLFVLGLRTTPPGGDDLATSGVGVSDIRIWQKVVAARAGNDNKVQLAFQGSSLKELKPSNAREYC
ncbi:hypothetical protein CH063_07843 [Colletotrichum higginsianum]|nr:hypothetical protein CH063_07843 [Colletotrichum higginsianum]